MNISLSALLILLVCATQTGKASLDTSNSNQGAAIGAATAGAGAVAIAGAAIIAGVALKGKKKAPKNAQQKQPSNVSPGMTLRPITPSVAVALPATRMSQQIQPLNQQPQAQTLQEEPYTQINASFATQPLPTAQLTFEPSASEELTPIPPVEQLEEQNAERQDPDQAPVEKRTLSPELVTPPTAKPAEELPEYNQPAPQQHTLDKSDKERFDALIPEIREKMVNQKKVIISEQDKQILEKILPATIPLIEKHNLQVKNSQSLSSPSVVPSPLDESRAMPTHTSANQGTAIAPPVEQKIAATPPSQAIQNAKQEQQHTKRSLNISELVNMVNPRPQTALTPNPASQPALQPIGYAQAPDLTKQDEEFFKQQDTIQEKLRPHKEALKLHRSQLEAPLREAIKAIIKLDQKNHQDNIKEVNEALQKFHEGFIKHKEEVGKEKPDSIDPKLNIPNKEIWEENISGMHTVLYKELENKLKAAGIASENKKHNLHEAQQLIDKHYTSSQAHHAIKKGMALEALPHQENRNLKHFNEILHKNEQNLAKATTPEAHQKAEAITDKHLEKINPQTVRQYKNSRDALLNHKQKMEKFEFKAHFT